MKNQRRYCDSEVIVGRYECDLISSHECAWIVGFES